MVETIKKMKALSFLMLFTLTSWNSYSQTDSLNSPSTQPLDTIYNYHFQRHVSLVTGIHYHKYLFAEAGIAIKDNGVNDSHPFTRILSLLNEISFIDQMVVGPKLGIWLSGGFGMGLNIIYYSNFKQGTLRFRPEIGLGFDLFRMFYGYNLALTNREANFINKHNFGLNILINLKKLKEVNQSPRVM